MTKNLSVKIKRKAKEPDKQKQVAKCKVCQKEIELMMYAGCEIVGYTCGDCLDK